MLEQFAKVSGLHVNQTKTQAMWIGSEANRADRPLDLAWSAELKITGIFFTYDQDRELELNLDKRMKKIKGVISSWKQRNLSLVGRTQILKTFVISQLLFVTNVIRVPENIIKQVDAIMYNFIWGGPDKIKRCVMIKPLEEGGMKVPDIKSKIATQRVGWIRRLLSGESHPWKEFPNLLLEQMGGAHILNSEIDMQYMKPKLPNFYYEILDAWTKLKLNMVPPKPAGEQCLWSNRNVKIGGKVIFFKEFAENGINYGDTFEHVNFGYAKKLTAVNAINLASLAWAPEAPKEVFIGGIVEANARLKWSKVSGAKGYKIYWRDTTSPTWDYSRYVETTEFTLEGIVIDNFFFGIASVDENGHESVVVFPNKIMR